MDVVVRLCAACVVRCALVEIVKVEQERTSSEVSSDNNKRLGFMSERFITKPEIQKVNLEGGRGLKVVLLQSEEQPDKTTFRDYLAG